MNKKDLIYIGIIIGIGLLSYFLWYQPLKDYYTKEDIERAKSEERIKELEKQVHEKDSIYNITKQERDNAITTIENRDENIKIVEKKYDSKIKTINRFNTDESISYFKTWINE